MQEERVRYEKLVESSRDSIDQLKQLKTPIETAASGVEATTARLDGIEQRLVSAEKLPWLFETLEERAEELKQTQEETSSKVSSSLEEAQQIHSNLESFAKKVDGAADLKMELEKFLEIDMPFRRLQEEAKSVRGQVEGTGEQIARLHEQQERLTDMHKLGTAKMEALDRRREELGRDMQDKERRISDVDQALNRIDGVRETVDEITREIGTLKALGDSVTQKTAELGARSEVMNQALTRADSLNQAMSKIDVGMQQQKDNEKILNSLQEQVITLRTLHDTVMERSDEVTALQRESEEETQRTRQDLAGLREEMKNTVNRFDFESRGLESVSQRVVDLRSDLMEFESRFEDLTKASQTVAELDTATLKTAERLTAISNDVERIDEEAAKLESIRRDLGQTGKKADELGVQVAKMVEHQPAVAATLRDFEQLRSSHAMVKDALEQNQLAHAEITRVRENLSETRSWLQGVEESLGVLREQVSELGGMMPTVESVQNKAELVSASMAEIESRETSVEALKVSLSELEALSGNLDKRGKTLLTQMHSAEQQFDSLASQAEEAERMARTIAEVSSDLGKSTQRADEVSKTMAEIETRCESVDELADRTRTLRGEIDQRQHALEEASADLERASELRQQAAASAQELDELAKQLAKSLSSADRRAGKVSEMSTELEVRVKNLESVEERLGAFEERLARWEHADQEITRTLEQISARQNTIESLKADMERMSVTAENTAANVRAITSAHRDAEEGRKLLEDVMGRLIDIRKTAGAIDDRKRQLTRAEERLARADALLVDINSGLSTLQAQKVIVDQAVERAGSLKFLLKQAEGMIEGLRDERRMTADVHAAVLEINPNPQSGEVTATADASETEESHSEAA
jgi:chromosome segregation ATPase